MVVLTTLIDFDGTAGWVLILTPLAVLTVIVVGVIAGRDRAASGPAPKSATAYDAVTNTESAAMNAQPEPVVGTRSARSVQESQRPRRHAEAAPEASAISNATPSVPRLQQGAARPAVASAGADQTSSDAATVVSAREAQLFEAEQRFDDAAVARLSLQLARDLIANGAHGEAVKSHLRRAIIIASRLKDDDTHAAARLELGDIMADEKDLTTACEHWQIARQIFWDSGAKAAQADVDRRMMANHCPTDWVLNDF